MTPPLSKEKIPKTSCFRRFFSRIFQILNQELWSFDPDTFPVGGFGNFIHHKISWKLSFYWDYILFDLTAPWPRYVQCQFSDTCSVMSFVFSKLDLEISKCWWSSSATQTSLSHPRLGNIQKGRPNASTIFTTRTILILLCQTWKYTKKNSPKGWPDASKIYMYVL